VAGMIAFYVMSKGKHPFGTDNRHDRDERIMHGNPNLSAVQDPLALDMVNSMLAFDRKERPQAKELVHHPYLWNDDEQYRFLVVVGNEEDVKHSHEATQTPLAVAIENTKPRVLPNGQNWKGLSVLPMLKGRYPANYTASVCKLLRMMRNIHHHYSDQTAEAQAELGNTPSPYKYFNTNFPNLMVEIYNVIKNQQDWTQRLSLQRFFPQS
ncbi:Serine/threonine-protein kinase/endoribonuclease IRE1, partial [Lamellibrachia satsuma]